MSLFIYMSQSMFNFDALTPDFMWYALESIGIRAESGFLPLNSYENRVYQFTDEERRRYVVKFYRPERWSNEQIQEEHDFTLELIDNEIPVAPPRTHQWQHPAPLSRLRVRSLRKRGRSSV